MTNIASTIASLGIDVSKDVLDICLLRDSGKPVFSQFANKSEGHEKLLTWARKQSAHAVRRFCMEATGSYSFAIALYLSEAGEYVSIVNPAHIKYSTPNGSANKTDKAAALEIAKFAQLHKPNVWVPPSEHMCLLTSLERHRTDLIGDRAKIGARLKDSGLAPTVRRSWTETRDYLSGKIADIEAEIKKLIDDHDDLKKNKRLLETIPGVGSDTAIRLLAEMPDVDQCPSAQSAAAFGGLSPKEHRSGTSVFKPTRISKAGNKHLRSCLYFPAISAMRYNPRIKQLTDRMGQKGKCKMARIVAAMRKLIMIAYGILKSGQPFQAEVKIA
jgi:transposase